MTMYRAGIGYTRIHCRKLEMEGDVVGKHAPANASKLTMTRAAIINSLPMRTI
jgi:hypothetical protein